MGAYKGHVLAMDDGQSQCGCPELLYCVSKDIQKEGSVNSKSQAPKITHVLI